MEINIRTLVVDDEPLAQELVAAYVRQVPFMTYVGCCSSAVEAMTKIEDGGIDLVFLDIQMPGLSGLSMAKALSGPNLPKIVFTTAYGEYALDGFKLDALDYLLKPFDFDEFMRVANKAKRLFDLESKAMGGTETGTGEDDTNVSTGGPQSEGGTFFFVKSEYKLVKIEIDKILYVEGLKDYVKIYLDGVAKPVLTLTTLKQMEARLSNSHFIRLHRSFIVNVKMISGVERSGVFVGNVRIPVGDGYKQKLQALLDRLTL